MARRLSSPVFVGRTDELETLLGTADVAASGHASLALVGGEAGVGKSRLVAEVAARLRERGWLVLEGGSVALGDDGLPFGPIVEALRALVRDVDSDRIVAAAGPNLAELARLVPELSGNDGDVPLPSIQSDWLQIRIFEGVLRLLGRLGLETPVLLVIEDLHWSDRSTRDLLAFLARNARDERLLIVGTFRNDEIRRRHPLTTWLAEAERQPRVERIDLTRFDRHELVELVTAISGVVPAATLVDSIARRSDGNAFFAEELVAAVDGGVDGGDHGRARLPETLRGVLLVRLAGASERATRLVEIAAVAGREVEHQVLADVCGLSEHEMGSALREAVEAQLLVAEGDDTTERYQFRHALAQEAAYDELLPSERRRLHAAYAQAMEARPAGGGAAAASRLVELAHHWTAAHDPSHALAAAIAAGDASRAVYAYAEAARQYERATELWEVVPVAARSGERGLADLFDAASAAATLIGDASRAVTLAQRALELVAAEGSNDQRRAQAHERLGVASWLAGDTATSIQQLEEAVRLLDGAPPSIGQARVLSGLAANLMLAGRSGESVAFAERAIESARTIGDRGIESRAMNVLGVDRATLGDLAGGIDLLRRSLAITPGDDPTAIPRAHANLGSVLEMAGFVDEALAVSLAGAEAIQTYGSELSFLTFLEANAASMLLELGRYPEAADLLERNRPRVLPGVGTIQLYVTLAHLAIRTGDLAAAREALEIARTEAHGIADAQFVIDLHTFGTEIALWDGDPAAALVTARHGFDRVVEMDDAVILGQLAIPAMHAAADLAVRARAGRDAAGAETAVAAARDVLEAYRASTARISEPDALAAQEIGWRMALCGAELSRAEGHDDAANWDAVRPALAARPAPFLEAYVLWRAAEALAASGGPEAAAERLREAHRLAARIGASLLGAEIKGAARRLRIGLHAAAEESGAYGEGAPSDESAEAAAAPSAPAAPADPFGLTGREREVLSLVAEGYTNKRIADALFISESTAGVHVSNILGKLGVASRTEAATIAVRLGLDRPAIDRVGDQ